MQTETITADQAADYIVWSAHQSGSFISNLKLQKLVYYVQAWHLAIFDCPLMPERFEAWIHGPAIPNLYRRFKHFSWKNIDEEVARPSISDGTASFIDEILEEYGPKDGLELEIISHHELPWMEARGGLPPDELCPSIISEATMQSCYSKRLTPEEIAEFVALERAVLKREVEEG